mgnify:CR=1 FL=1
MTAEMVLVIGILKGKYPDKEIVFFKGKYYIL